ncbi:hypothetical protein FWF48_01840 [Candidatus Saccharibacteria bacterium]|nr:hypothetical protein [Candidatus Saccharibacteria bacterium]
MKEQLDNIKLIMKNDRQVFITMVSLVILSLVAVVLGVVSIHPSVIPVWYRYVSMGEYYYRVQWYYLISFIILAVVLGGLHNLIAIRLYKKHGKVPTLLFLAFSIFLVLFLIAIMLNVFGINKEAGIWI